MSSTTKAEVQTHKNYVNGQWVAATSGKTFAVYDPSTEEVIANVAAADATDADYFFNLGYGWRCKHCSVQNAEDCNDANRSGYSSHKREGQNETSLALARWTDDTRRALKCPQCGIEELVT